MPGSSDVKIMRLRYAGECGCGAQLDQGDRAGYDRVAKVVVCEPCLGGHQPVPQAARVAELPREAPLPGVPGAAARREFERRTARRDAEIAQMRGLRRFVNRHTAPPQSTLAWAVGARGEVAVGEALTELAADWVYALHDRTIPRSRANIDHIAVAATGVYVIDAKRYADAKVSIRRTGGFLSPVREQLLVNGRDRNSLLAGLASQLVAVSDALAAVPGLADVPVLGALCFVDADLSGLSRKPTVAGIHVFGRRSMKKSLQRPGELDVHRRYEAYCVLAAELKPMT